MWVEEKPGLASYIVSLYMGIESGREVVMAGVRGLCVFLSLCNKHDS